MTSKELYKLKGRQFTVGKIPVVFTIEDVGSTYVHLKSNISQTIQTLRLESFLTAHRAGAFSYVGEPVKIANKPVEEEQTHNLFSLEDL